VQAQADNETLITLGVVIRRQLGKPQRYFPNGAKWPSSWPLSRAGITKQNTFKIIPVIHVAGRTLHYPAGRISAVIKHYYFGHDLRKHHHTKIMTVSGDLERSRAMSALAASIYISGKPL
jgi:hypothetical protein